MPEVSVFAYNLILSSILILIGACIDYFLPWTPDHDD